MNNLLKVNDVAKMLGISERSVWRFRDQGRLPAPLKLGGVVRWRENEICEWIKDGCPDIRSNKERIR